LSPFKNAAIDLFLSLLLLSSQLKYSSSTTQSAATTRDAQQKMMKLQAQLGEASGITSHQPRHFVCVTIFDAATLGDPYEHRKTSSL